MTAMNDPGPPDHPSDQDEEFMDNPPVANTGMIYYKNETLVFLGCQTRPICRFLYNHLVVKWHHQ